MSFPQLLRRSSFATHDPLITRIYTSTPSSIAQTGDWGLKYPIHRPKGPKYIKVSNLDAGSAIGSDWRSGEKEARFMEAWGTARVRWTAPGEGRMNLAKKRNSMYDSPSAGSSVKIVGGKERTELLPDVEAMTEVEFERYLEKIRERRSELLPQRIEEVDERRKKDWRADEGDYTLVNLAVGRHTMDEHGTRMQSALIHQNITEEGSTLLHSKPHISGGLHYSNSIKKAGSSISPFNPSHGISYIDPRTTLPGRALNRKDRNQHRNDGVQAGRNMPSDTNAPFVVSIGGLTAASQAYGSTADDATISETDYTRTQPERGVGRFQIREAKFGAFPTVLNLASSGIKDKYGNGLNITSKAKHPSPLDTFKFDIELDLASASTKQGEGKKVLEPGSRAWVGREQGRRLLTAEDALGRGQPRKDRIKGQALRDLKRESDEEVRATHKQRVDGISALIQGYGQRQSGRRE